jgi:hypothetical protein
MEDNRVRLVEYMRTLDGDTFEGRTVALPGMKPKMKVEAAIRVKNWNAAELSEAEGAYMREEFKKLLTAGKIITVRLSVMSFERVVCDVWIDGVLFEGTLARRLGGFRALTGVTQLRENSEQP